MRFGVAVNWLPTGQSAFRFSLVCATDIIIVIIPKGMLMRRNNKGKLRPTWWPEDRYYQDFLLFKIFLVGSLIYGAVVFLLRYLGWV